MMLLRFVNITFRLIGLFKGNVKGQVVYLMLQDLGFKIEIAEKQADFLMSYSQRKNENLLH